MKTLTKNIFFRPSIIFLIAFSFLLIFDQNVDAKFIKKVTIEPFTSPIGWEKAFNPGIFFSLFLYFFQLIKPLVIQLQMGWYYSKRVVS